MTLKEKVAEVQPDDVDYVWICGVFGCPCDYDFLGVKEKCQCIDVPFSEELCEKCWNRPYIEPEVQDA